MVLSLGMLLYSLLPLSQQAIWHPLAVYTGDQCTVVNWMNFNKSLSINVLSYITPNYPLNITLLFQDHEQFSYHDALYIYNHQTIRYKERKGHSNNNYTSPVAIPEGWNRLKLIVTDKNVRLKWTNGNDEVSLLALTLDLSVANVFLRGIFSVCSGVSPEWDVSEGKEVTILLQPLQSEQLLEVTGNGSLIVHHEISTETQSRFANTTLRIKTRRQDLHSFIGIKEKNEGDQEVYDKLEVPRPQLTVTSVGGMTHLSLKLFDGDASEEDGSSSIVQDIASIMVTPKHFITHFFVFISGLGIMYIINIARSALMRKDGDQTGQNQEEQDQEREQFCEIPSSARISDQVDSSGHVVYQKGGNIRDAVNCFSIKNRSTST